jgi:hypothetical protein
LDFKYSTGLNTTRYGVAPAGTQTAALAFGGQGTSPNPSATTGATEEYDGTSWTNSVNSLNTARKVCRWSRYSNSWFSFWWRNNQLLQEQQKNITEQLGQQFLLV